jgi:alpha-beta hydrolase superfamily lysophospholipase
MADPLVHKVATARWFTEAKEAQRRMFSLADQIDTPFLLLQGGEDRIVDAAEATRFFDLAEPSDKTFRLYDTLYHEILNEPEWASIVAEVIEWMSKRVDTAVAA